MDFDDYRYMENFEENFQYFKEEDGYTENLEENLEDFKFLIKILEQDGFNEICKILINFKDEMLLIRTTYRKLSEQNLKHINKELIDKTITFRLHHHLFATLKKLVKHIDKFQIIEEYIKNKRV